MSLDYVLNKFRLIGIFGMRGSGKTALMVFLIRMLSNSLGLPVACNFELKIPNARRYGMSDLVGSEFVDTIIGCDEIYSLADSRLSLSMQNIYYSYFISQIRKSPHVDGSRGLGNFCVYTAQLQSMADVRVFEQSSLYIMMEQLPNGDFFMEWANQEGEGDSSVIPYGFFMKEAFNFYSTDEKVMPLAVESMRVELEKFEPERRNRRIDLVVEEFLAEFEFKGWRDVQRFTVQDFLERKGVPERLCLPVWNRVREKIRLKKS